jgi:antiviral defense system Shedu protein SduA
LLRSRLLIIVEIEAPHHRLFNQRGDQTAEVTHAFGQVTDWKHWVTVNGAYARANIPELANVEDPDGLVIIGRRPESSHARKRLRQSNRQHPSVAIRTYDDLLGQVEQYLHNLHTYLAQPPEV